LVFGFVSPVSRRFRDGFVRRRPGDPRATRLTDASRTHPSTVSSCFPLDSHDTQRADVVEDSCGRLACLVAETAARHLSSRAFVAAARREAASAANAAASVAASDQTEPQASAETRAELAAASAAAAVARTLQAGYATLAENALVMLRAAAAATDPLGRTEGNAESAAKAERAGRRVLAALDGLLAPGAYLRAIAPLLENDDGRVRRKALRLIAHRMRAAAAAEAARARGAGKTQSRRARSRARAQAHRQASREKRKNAETTDASLDANGDEDVLEEELADEVSAAASLMPRLASLAGADAGASTRAAALGALEAAAVRFGSADFGNDAERSSLTAKTAPPGHDESSLKARREASAAFAAPLLATTPAMVAALGAPARAVAAAAANATAALVRALGPRALPALPAAVPALFAAARGAAASLQKMSLQKIESDADPRSDDDDDEKIRAVKNDEGHVLVACLRAVTALMDRLGGFLSPHLGDVLALLLSPSLVPDPAFPNAGSDAKASEAAAAETTEKTEKTEKTKTEAAETTKTAAVTAAAHAAALRETLPRYAPPRLLLGPLGDAMRAALGDAGEENASVSDGRVSAAAAAAALRMAASCVASAGSFPPAHRDALVSMLLRALDVRRSHPPSFDGAAIDLVEGAAAEAFVTAASSLTESAFAPTLATATEWAKARASDPEAARARLSALFRVASALADALRGVFTPLAAPILDLAAAALDPEADGSLGSLGSLGADAKRRRKEKSSRTEIEAELSFRAECDAWRTRARALGAVRRICAHDSGEIIDAARFNRLHPLVSACLSAKPPAVKPGKGSRDASSASSFSPPADLADLPDDAALAPGGVGAEAAACVAALIAAAPDDALWKPAHRGALQATRDAAPRARRVAVAALAATTARLQEEFLTLLPESIPYLSELFEDPDEEVEGAARELTATLAELSGEDLKSLMATGGE